MCPPAPQLVEYPNENCLADLNYKCSGAALSASVLALQVRIGYGSKISLGGFSLGIYTVRGAVLETQVQPILYACLIKG